MKELDLQEYNIIKILGLQWNPKSDDFSFKVNPVNIKAPTKRLILSEASKVFDPLGWLSPIIIKIKVLFQRLWLIGIDWDDQLPSSLSSEWTNIMNEFQDISDIKIERYVPLVNSFNSIHGFSDASETAYAAAIYIKTKNLNGTTAVQLITSKTKVAPLKQVSLPRLELCGAVLLARLMKRVIEVYNIDTTEIYLWTDSNIVLKWLSDHPRRWKTFIANRTSDILQSFPRVHWNHVQSQHNPADCASRGLMPSKLKSFKKWWHGPEWLELDSSQWPSNTPCNESYSTETLEERRTEIATMTNKIISNSLFDELFNKYSKFSKISRILSFCMRFIYNSKKVNQGDRRRGPISSLELKASETMCIKWAQSQGFYEEIKLIKRGESVPKKNKLFSLSPFLDTSGTMRVRGRLQNSNCKYDVMHPIILPKSHILSRMIVEQFHLKFLHPGPSLLSSLLKQVYWIIEGRSIVRAVVHHCVTCARHTANASQQLMWNLPAVRVTPCRAFLNVGVDYAGPIPILNKRSRGAKTTKGYIALFVCMAVKAVHLEVVSDLSANAFIAAFRRFIARRGLPSNVYSDNGSNFIGANRQLSELHKLTTSNGYTTEVQMFLTDQHITWHFIPPISPHVGGVWESNIKQVKTHLIKSAGATNLTYEELQTLLCQIEAILNSRPLWPTTEEVEDINVLTPGHFLIMAPVSSAPDENLLEINSNRINHFQRIQQQVQYFWKRYSSRISSSFAAAK